MARRVLLVGAGHAAARALRDAGAEVVLLPDAEAAAVLAAATQEAVDEVRCLGPRAAELEAAVRAAGLDMTVSPIAGDAPESAASAAPEGRSAR